MPNDATFGSGTSKRAYFGGWECFKDAKIEGSLNFDAPIAQQELLTKLQALPDGARSGIIWTWPSKSNSHIIACEKFQGKLIFIDPQRGTVGPNNLGMGNSAIGYTFFRVDDLELDENFEWNEIIRKKK